MHARLGGAGPSSSSSPSGGRASARARARGSSLIARATPKPNHYDVLGVDVDASEEDIRAAFRRKAKELHPDVNQEAGAGAAFIAAKEAYETLSDPGRRRAYDAETSARGFGFFRDVDVGPSGGGAERGGAAERSGGSGGGRGVNPWETHRRIWEEEEAKERAQSGDDGAGPPTDPAEFLERLSRVMGGRPGAGGLTGFQSGRLDPFGTSSSDAWFRRVEEQRSAPFGGRGGGVDRGFDRGFDRGNPEWQRYRPGGGGGDDDDGGFDGWRPPGRPEWRRPGRPGDDDGDNDGWGRGGGGGGGGGGSRPLKGDDFRRGGGGGGGFRGW